MIVRTYVSRKNMCFEIGYKPKPLEIGKHVFAQIHHLVDRCGIRHFFDLILFHGFDFDTKVWNMRKVPINH